MKRLLTAALLSAAAAGQQVYVSPEGHDSAAGTASQPLRTLGAAQRAARALLEQRPLTVDVVVHVGPGVYYQPEPLRFTAADSGRDGHRMKWRGPGPAAGLDPARAAVVHGGSAISGWKRVGDSPVWRADVSMLRRPFFNLVENMRGGILARHPDYGSGYLKDVGCNNSATQILCPMGVLPPDLDAADASVFANLGGNWFTSTYSVANISGTSDGGVNVTFLREKQYAANARVYVQGAKQLISEGGEWALDSRAATLFYWPRDFAAMAAGTLRIVASTSTRILDFRGETWREDGGVVSGVDVEGLVLSGSDFASNFTLFQRTNDTPLRFREGMVRFENASDCVLRNCALLDAGHSAVWLQSFAQNITLVGNHIARPGFCGIFFQGVYPGDTWPSSTGGESSLLGPIRTAAQADINKYHYVSDNLIYDYGQRVGHASGMWWFQAGTMLATHNHVQEGPRDAFGVYGNRFGSMPGPQYGQNKTFWTCMDWLHTRHIELSYNHISNALRDSSDAGALEYWGVGRSNTAHSNCISDMDPAIPDGAWLNILFQDDFTNYLNFSSNVLFEIHGAGSQEAAMIKSVGSVFENNIVADSTLGHLMNLSPFLEPAANMIYRRNVFVNITTTGNGACGACMGPQKNACHASCPQCAKHQSGCNGTAAKSCRQACAARCAVPCGTGPPVPGQPMPPPVTATLDTTINDNTAATLLQSSRLSGRASEGYSFEAGPPPKGDLYGVPWPPLSVNDSVVREWDSNLYCGVANYSGAYNNKCPPEAGCNLTNYTHGQSAHWDTHALYSVDPLLRRSAGTESRQPWDLTCVDYKIAGSSPLWSRLPAFRSIDVAAIGLTATGFQWNRAALMTRSALWPEKIQAERYQRQRGLWRQGSYCISAGAVAKGFTWAEDGNSWAKYEHISLGGCASGSGVRCVLSVRFRSVTNATFAPQPSAPAAPIRIAMAVGAPVARSEVAVIEVSNHLEEWTLLNATVDPHRLSQALAAGDGGELTLYLRISSQCQIDYFYFTPNVSLKSDDKEAWGTRMMASPGTMTRNNRPPGQAYWWHYPYSLCYAPESGYIPTPAGLPSLEECPSTEGQGGLYPMSPECVSTFKAVCEATHNCGGYHSGRGFFNSTVCLANGGLLMSREEETLDMYLLGNAPEQPVLFSPVWPAPQHIQLGSTRLELAGTFAVTTNATCAGGGGSILSAAAARYQALLRPGPAQQRPRQGEMQDLASVSVCVQTTDESLGPATAEDYTLHIGSGGSTAVVGSITATTVYGALHALETLTQLCGLDSAEPHRVGGSPYNYSGLGYIGVAPVTVVDHPIFRHRGLMIDTGRRYLPVKTIERIIDGLAMAKLNVLHWHISDSQSFPSESALFPGLAAEGAYHPSAVYSVQVMRDIVQYARHRGVRVLPEWDLPGHGRWRGVPGLPVGCAGTRAGLFGQVLDPTNASTYTFLASFLSEMGEIFTDPYLFLGGDEVGPSCFAQHPAMARWMQEHHMNGSQVENYFLQMFGERVAPLLPNKSFVIWEADAVPIDIASLPPRSIVDPFQSPSTADAFIEAGVPVILSSAGLNWYLDGECAGYNHQAWQCTYWGAPGTAVPASPIGPHYTPAQAALVLGGEVSMWGDDVNADVIGAFVWRGALALAERLWSAPSALRDPRMNNAPTVRLAQQGCRMRMRGVGVGPTQAGWCPADSLPPPVSASSTEQRELLLLQQEVARLRSENEALRLARANCSL